jgi:hypothetical protein
MLNTYIRNKGVSKTFIHKNNRNYISKTDWDADYDGDVANINVDENENGLHHHYRFSLTNEDLANMLNVESVNMPIDKRLEMDFNQQQPRYKLQVIPSDSRMISSTGIESPVANEEFIIPLSSQPKMVDYYTLTPTRKHRRHKSHASHKVYKIRKSKSRKSSSTKRSRSKTHRR